MRKLSVFVMMALVGALYVSAAFAAGQTGKDTSAPGESMTGAPGAPSTGEHAGAMSAEDNKDAYSKKIESDLNAYDQRISELKDKSKKLQGSSKDRFDQALANLEKRKGEANDKLDELKSASEENWRTSKKDVDEAMQNVRKAYEEARFGL